MNSKLLIAVLSLVVLLVLSTVTLAQTPNLEVTAALVSEAPTIDGVLDDAAWLQASLRGAKVVQDVNHEGRVLTEYPRIAYLAYDADALYIAFLVLTPDVSKLRTANANPWDNDDLEVFVDPVGSGYFQIAMDSGGQVFVSDGGPKVNDLSIAMTKEGIRWVVEIAIPFDAIGVHPEAGDEWGLGLTGRQITPRDLWLTWNPTYGGFLNPARFGRVVFGE